MQMSSQKADEKPEAPPKSSGGIRARLAKLGGGIPMPGPRRGAAPTADAISETCGRNEGRRVKRHASAARERAAAAAHGQGRQVHGRQGRRRGDEDAPPADSSVAADAAAGTLARLLCRRRRGGGHGALVACGLAPTFPRLL